MAAAPKPIELAAGQELDRLQSLAAHARVSKAKLAHLAAALRDACPQHAMQQEVMQVPSITERLHQLGNKSTAVMQQSAWEPPPAMLVAHEAKALAEGVLKLLKEVRVAVQGLGELKASMEATLELASKWDALVVSHQNRCYNENTGQSLLLRLPPAALSTISRRAGQNMRLVCSQLYHASGSAGTGFRLPQIHAYATSAQNAELCQVLSKWACPREVLALRGDVGLLHADSFRLAMSTFTDLQQMDLSFAGRHRSLGPCDLSLLPRTLQKLHLTLVGWQPLPLPCICRLTGLQLLQLREYDVLSDDLVVALAALPRLTNLALRSSSTMGPEIWDQISLLPALQQLRLDAQLCMSSPMLGRGRQMQALRWVTLTGEGGGVAHEYAAQVFRLFPSEAAVAIQDVCSAILSQDGQAHYLSQALTSSLVSSLTVSAGADAGLHAPIHPPDLVASLRATIPQLAHFGLHLKYPSSMDTVIQPLLEAPLPRLQSLSLAWRVSRHDSFTLLNSIAPGLLGLTALTLATNNFRVESGSQPHFLSSLPKLQQLSLFGHEMAAKIGPHLTALAALTSLSLHAAMHAAPWLSMDDPTATPPDDDEADTHLPSSCSALTALTGLKVLRAWNPRIGNDGVCWFPLVRQLSSLEQLAVHCATSFTPDELAGLLPVGASLKVVVLTGVEPSLEAVVHATLQGCVREVRVNCRPE